ncbi:MAG: hypothetical protein IH899_10195 [Planctomycetes bacterium]|nr:hypothetical protein [Planctomycetota bacterium]
MLSLRTASLAGCSFTTHSRRSPTSRESLKIEQGNVRTGQRHPAGRHEAEKAAEASLVARREETARCAARPMPLADGDDPDALGVREGEERDWPR